MSENLFRVTQTKLHHVVDELRRFHVVPLDERLSSDYFVLFHCAPDPDNNEGYVPSRTSFRLVADPYGTGDLGSSGGNFLVIENQSNTSRAPRVHMTIVECLDGSDANGFRLRDAKQVSHPATSSTGEITWTETVSNVVDYKKCWVVGGMWGAGAGGGSALSSNITREFLTSNTDLEVKKFSNASFVLAADMVTTVQIVEWGEGWEVTRQDFGLVNTNPTDFEDPSIYTQHTIIDWDGNPKPLDFDHTMMHLSWYSEANNGRLHNQIPIVRPGNGLASTMQGAQSTIAGLNAENAAGSFSVSAYTASNPNMNVLHFTPERGTAAMPRVEQALPVGKPFVPSKSESSDSASSGVDLNFKKLEGVRIPFVQYTGKSANDNDNDGPMIADFELNGSSFTYNSISAATGDTNSHLYVQVADLSLLNKQEEEEALPTLDEAGKKGIPGLKALVVRELFEIDELVDHVEGRIVGTHEQVKPGDEGSSVKMPRIIVEAISGNARWHGGVQTVTVAVYTYSRNGYSDAAQMYELVRAKLQHTRLNRAGFSPRGIIRETERPHDGYNQQVDGYFIRGLFTYVGTL